MVKRGFGLNSNRAINETLYMARYVLRREAGNLPERLSRYKSEPFIVGGDATKPIVFILQKTGEERKAVARSVQIGERANGQVEIRSGLQPGDTFVVRSNQPLKSGQSVRLSILSETSP
ncbi:hypothetical protein [Leptolyngbya sp. 7M]|uniref:hypothetical protein n=1 Tax=Leptolyngbya sp. 7M TaxID=2812896 RepID=UPI001B8ABE41|nr:hypothetical protein [Leptolyngbya sp. 7M]QYO68297.1 hypothetical protein JVX88_16920 [Leptolyngbya sp. 7M]